MYRGSCIRNTFSSELNFERVTAPTGKSLELPFPQIQKVSGDPLEFAGAGSCSHPVIHL